MTNRDATKKYTYGVVGLLVLILAGVVFWVLTNDTQLYERDKFSMVLPNNMTVEEESNRVTFTTKRAETDQTSDASGEGSLKSGAETAAATFGVQVSCSSRDSKNALTQMDEARKNGTLELKGAKPQVYKTVTIQNAPARYFEYQNDVHSILGALVQNDTSLCLVAEYVPKNDEAKWRPVAEKALYSLKIK